MGIYGTFSNHAKLMRVLKAISKTKREKYSR